ncbi:P-II family nitrogen regulator [Natronospira bacteriovora]|uniref:Transcriptional regulator n=1 Tax=Natronospira bacteriovora TaxID=3069753 RepID=A0ABU0W4E5_9GAMM|nr:transcriptional regulator [Natronospira sp. AB-CW4]MDQ2068891.1 transcriptional regulator [Natronospira sp. AB-CW4]
MRRKLLTVITEEALERPLVKIIRDCGARGYTITEARGAGRRGARAPGVEQGANIRVEVICEEQIAWQIAELLHQKYFKDFAMVLYLAEVDVIRGEKF